MKNLQVEDDLLDDLKLLKGILRKANMTEVIRGIMKSAGYAPAFFEQMDELQRRMPGDSPD